MRAFIATFYSPEIQAELLNEILEYYGAQSTVQRATDLKSGGKKNPPRNKEVLGQTRPRVFSTRNISTEFSTPIQNFTRQERSTIWPLSTQHFSGIHMLIYAPVEANS